MRIGVVTTSYPRHEGDHAGNFVAAHVCALRALGHEVDVIAAGSTDEHAVTGELGVVRVPGALFYAGGAPDELEQLGWRAAPEAVRFTARLTTAIARRSRANAWDAAIAHWLVPSAIAAAAALPHRLPLLAIGHGGDVHTLRRTGLLAPVLRALRLRGARLAVVSEELRALCAPHLDAIVQPMGIDVAHFASLGRAPTSPPTVAFIGRWVPVKGVDVLFAAMPFIERPTRLVVGTPAGPPEADVIARHEVPRHQQIVRYLHRSEQRDQILREASVLVVPSRVLPNGRGEGTPVVAIEALAAGVPVVASAVGGLRELPVMHVPPEDPRALAAMIERALTSPPPLVDLRAYAWSEIARRLTP